MIRVLPAGGAVIAETRSGDLINHTNIHLYIIAFSWKITCIIARIWSYVLTYGALLNDIQKLSHLTENCLR